MASGFFALLDDIAAIMDDVAVMSKIAAKKTAGILGDDLAVNAEKASGFISSREIPVLWAIAKGSFINKLIILPIAFLLSAFFPLAIIIILVLGGLFLAYEGAEKIYEYFFPHKHAAIEIIVQDFTEAEILALEKDKIKSAIVTDFILSVEIVIIALGTVIEESLAKQIAVVSIIAILATVGVYGIVALIVRMDELGFKLIKRSTNERSLSKTIGNILVQALPKVIKSLSVIGTIALVLVAGGIFVHNIDFLHHLFPQLPSIVKEFGFGLIVGLLVLGMVNTFKKIIGKKMKLKMKTKPINLNLLCIALTVVMTGWSKNSVAQNLKANETYKGIEFKMAIVKEPIIPNNSVNIKDFGAVNGGTVLNTKAFADAIAAVSKKGGGKVIIPPGIWLTGPILLKSNLELYAETGALIKFSTDKSLYPLIETSFEGLNTWRCISPIYGKNLENVAFTGKGVWDGSGEVWRQVKKGKVTEGQWKKFVASGGVLNEKKDSWYPSETFMKASVGADQNVRLDLKTKEDFEAIHDFLRPVLVSIQNSKRVLFDGPVFQNSPAWNIHPLMIEDLIVRNVSVRNPWFSQNGDGLDVESCKNVLVENSSFDVGDDAICIKSGKDKDGRDRGVPCENIIIRNNIVYHGHGGVTVGSEMSSGVKNMHVSNCSFMGTDVGLRFKSNRGRGGVVENIFISDIFMTDIPSQAISFDLYYGGKSIAETLAEGGNTVSTKIVPVDEKTPQFKNISIKNITIAGAYQAVFLQGLPEMNLENIEIFNLIGKADKGFSIIDAKGIKLGNIKLDIKESNVFDIYNSKNVSLKNVEFNSTSPKAVTINGAACENIELVSSPKLDYSKTTIIGDTVPKGAVKL